MVCTKQNGVLTIDAEKYILSLGIPPEPSLLTDKRTGRFFFFTAGGDCAVSGAHLENCTADSPWEQTGSSMEFRRRETSNLWKSKTFVIRAEEDSVCFYHELDGEGNLEDVRFFRGCYQGNEYGFAGDMDDVWSAAPNFREQEWFHPTARVIITNGDDLSMCSGGTAIASVPHVMALHDRRDKALVGAAVFAGPGEYLWDDMVWNPEVRMPPTDYIGDQSLAGGFAIRYCGKKHISGAWTSPRLVFTFPDSVEQVVPCALEYAYRNSLLPRPVADHKGPAWWKEPIYCTWHDQTSFVTGANADYHKPMRKAGEFCTQELSERWLQQLIDHGAKPGIVILDDKWQKSKLDSLPDPVKWPDMRGWIDSCHVRNVKVFLWGLAWHNEDIPLDEAMTRDGKIVCGDITNPKYEARLRRQIRFNFSDAPGCLNADGVKIDGMLNLPTGPGLKNHQNIWGLELQRYLLNVIYDEAKKVKKDVCISTFSANPYLDEFTDMVRLADMYTYRPTTAESMRWRKSLYQCTHPGVPVDTDGQLNFLYHPDYEKILELERELGVPTVYNAEYVRFSRFFLPPRFRKFTDKDYKVIARVFAEYRKGLK